MKALLLVDLQNDFVAGGSLAVPRGHEVIPIANSLMSNYDVVVATQDWHPAGHKSFASQHAGKAVGNVITLDGLDQLLWPDHCVQGTPGAEFCSELNFAGIHEVIRKGTDCDIDSYSGFYDNGHRKATGLDSLLRAYCIKRLFIMGLATDYCVKFTALDAIKLGFETTLITDGCRGVELQAGDCNLAIEQMRRAGVTVHQQERSNET